MAINSKSRLTTFDIVKVMGLGAVLGTVGFFIGLLFNVPSSVTIPITGGLAGVIAGAIISQKYTKNN